MGDQQRPTVFLHIGAPKTGTTYLQAVLHANRAALREAGLLYPGTENAHFWPSQDLRGKNFHGYVDSHVRGAWDQLVKEVRGWPDRTLIDHESLAGAKRPAIDRALRDLDFADVHIVFTARDLARQLPASWQERIKNGSKDSYRAFLSSVANNRGNGRRFWAVQHAPTVLARWARDLPPDHVHVVTVPPSGSDPDLLWRRFAGLLGLDPDAYDSSQRGANTSLGAAEAAVLRAFNTEIADGDLPWPAYASVIKQRLAPALAQREGKAIELPQRAFGWAVARSQQMVADLEAAGYDVVGDLDDLIPAKRPTGRNPDRVPEGELAEASVAAMVALGSLVADSRVATHALRRSRRNAVLRRAEKSLRRAPGLRALYGRLARRFR